MKRGQYVEHPTCLDWGVGEIIDVSDENVIVNFRHAGRKKLNTNVVKLQVVENAEPVPLKPDIGRLEVLCNRFYADQEHNRKGTNDGNMAMLVLADVKRYGQPTAQHRRRLLDWCHTDGSVFQSGVPLAREICTAIYGRILPDPDVMEKKPKL